MPRAIPDHRFADLVDSATSVFIRAGYRRTQMSDVAAEAGVAKGTLYLYFESKEALFDAALRHADRGMPPGLPETLPLPTPPPGATLEYVRKRVAEEAALPALAAALARRRVTGAAAELEAILHELYDRLARNRTAIELVDRCAADRPDLAGVWFEAGRRGALAPLTGYVADRARRGHLRAFPDPAVAARIALETVTFWAVHRHWDPAPQAVDEVEARETVVQFVRAALLAS